MAATHELVNVQLSQHAAALIQQAQELGGYTSPSQVIEEALRGWSEPTEELESMRAIWQEAMANPGEAATEAEVFEPLLARLEARARQDGLAPR